MIWKLAGIPMLIQGIMWTLRKISQSFNPEAMKLAGPSYGPDQPIFIIQSANEPAPILGPSEEAGGPLAIESPSLSDQNQIRIREGPKIHPNVGAAKASVIEALRSWSLNQNI